MKQPILSRELIEAGGIDAMVARSAPDLPIMTEAERIASLQATLEARPPGDVWLFGYGSLIWNPTVHSLERRVARIEGWHRAFCLSTAIGRGTRENPGLVLGLDAGGDCTGVAFRIEEAEAERELTLVWRREMLARAYHPRWLDLFDAQGGRFAAGIAFTIDPASHLYAGGLSEAETIARLATAAGALGSAADYLFQTCEELRRHSIPDPALEAIERRVRTSLATAGEG